MIRVVLDMDVEGYGTAIDALARLVIAVKAVKPVNVKIFVEPAEADEPADEQPAIETEKWIPGEQNDDLD